MSQGLSTWNGGAYPPLKKEMVMFSRLEGTKGRKQDAVNLYFCGDSEAIGLANEKHRYSLLLLP